MRPWTLRKMMILVALVALPFAGLLALSREEWNRRRNRMSMQCTSNLRIMIWPSIAQYEHLNHAFPPGTIPNPSLPLDRRLGWGVTLLRYIDMVEYLPDRGLTQEAAEKLPWDDPAFASLASSPPSFTHCTESKSGSTYIGIAGLGPDAPSLPTHHERAGIFGDDRRVTHADVKDGLSHTMMVVESSAKSGPWFAGGRATVRGVDPAHRPHIGPGRPFGGLHRGPANVLMADGSIKWISESIDPKVFEALSTIAGGEAVPADFND